MARKHMKTYSTSFPTAAAAKLLQLWSGLPFPSPMHESEK